jgi:CBS domain-containing protein
MAPEREALMDIGELCSREVYVVQRSEPLAQAVREMYRRHVGAIVVVEPRGNLLIPVGIVTDRDVLRGQVKYGADLFELTVGHVMTAQPLTLAEGSGLAEGIAGLRSRGVRRAPVVAASGDLVGIVSLDDLLPAVAEELGGLARLMGSQAARET